MTDGTSNEVHDQKRPEEEEGGQRICNKEFGWLVDDDMYMLFKNTT